jgi:hypothetical protein
MPSIDVKHIFIGDNTTKLCLSSGVSISNMFWIGTSNNIYYNLLIPIYFSYYSNEYFSYYCSPKYLLISEYVREGPISERGDYNWSNQAGITNGFCFGHKTRFLIEHTFYVINYKKYPYNTLNAGIIFQF